MRGEIDITAYDFYTNIYHLKNKELIRELMKVTESRYLKKGDHIVRAGEVKNDIYFMETGMVRGYYFDINGKEITDCFRFRCGDVVTSISRLELDVPSLLSLEMLEDGMFFCVPMSVVIGLQVRYPEILMLYSQILVSALDEHWKLKQAFVQYNADQRYRWFQQEYPGLIDLVSNKYIASFLGMTPVTLSRLRRVIKEEQLVKI